MHVLISGGAGFIGSHVAAALLARGDRVTILDSLVRRVHPRGLPPAHLPPSATLIRGSVTSKAAWRRALADVDAVVHLAAYQDYQPDFSRFAKVNAAGTALLYEILVESRAPVRKVVVASSQAVYGEGAYHCTEHGLQHPPPRSPEQLERAEWAVVCPVCGGDIHPVASDELQPNPHNAYAISKLALERYALVLGRRYEIPSVALRYSIIQGPRQSPANAYSGVLRAFTGRLLHGKAPLVFEDGQQLRDYTHVEDAVAATLLVLDDPRANYQVFNVGSGQTVSVLEYAQAVARALGTDLTPEIGGRYRVGDTRHVWSDTAKLRSLGWRPTKGVTEVIVDYLAALDRRRLETDWASQAYERMQRSGTVRRTRP